MQYHTGDLLTDGVRWLVIEKVHDDTLEVVVHNEDTDSWDNVPDGVGVDEIQQFYVVREVPAPIREKGTSR